MKSLFIRLYYTLFFLTLLACEVDHSRYRIQKEPVFDEKFTKTSLTAIEEMAAKEPYNADLHFKKAALLLKLNRNAEAITSIEKAISLDNKNPEFYLLATQAYLRENKPELAMAAALNAEKTGISNSWLFSTLANISWENGDSIKALTYIDKAISSDPKNAQSYLNKGNLMLNMNDTAQAIDNFHLSYKIDSTNIDLLNHLYEVSFAKKQYPDASKYLSSIISRREPDYKLQMQAAVLLWKTHQPDSAKALFTQLAAQDQADYLPYQYISSLEFQRKAYDSAGFYADKALSLNSDCKEALLTQARIKDIQKQYYNSLAQYDKILRIDGNFLVALEERARVQKKINNLAKLKQSESVPVLPTLQPL